MKVTLLAHTPNPEEIVYKAAKVCVSDSPINEICTSPDRTEKTIEKIIRQGHLSVLEHAAFTFSIENISRVCLAQLTRHRLASFSVKSQRFTNSRRQTVVSPDEVEKWIEHVPYNYDRVFNSYEELMHFFVPVEDARYILPQAVTTSLYQGCHFHISKDNPDDFPNGVFMAATNSHRLAVNAADGSNIFIDKELDCIISAAQLLEVSKYLKDNSVKIQLSKKSASFTFNNLIFVARVIAGDFPDYKKITDGNFDSKVVVNTSELFDAVERVSVVSKRATYSNIFFKIANNQIEIFSSTGDGLTAKEVVNAEVEGGVIDIAFNVNYILDALKVLDEKEKCVIHFNNNESFKPIKMGFDGSDDFIYVVTPVRMS